MFHLASQFQMLVGTTTKIFVTTAKCFCNNFVSQCTFWFLWMCRTRTHEIWECIWFLRGFRENWSWGMSRNLSVSQSECRSSKFSLVSVANSEVWKKGRQCHEMLARATWCQLDFSSKPPSMLKMNKNVVATWHLFSSSCQSTKTAPNNRKSMPPTWPKRASLNMRNCSANFFASNSSLFNVGSPYVHEKKKDTCCPSVLPVFP